MVGTGTDTTSTASGTDSGMAVGLAIVTTLLVLVLVAAVLFYKFKKKTGKESYSEGIGPGQVNLVQSKITATSATPDSPGASGQVYEVTVEHDAGSPGGVEVPARLA